MDRRYRMGSDRGRITVVVGGQFGGEGKGKITSHLCRVHGYDAAVRCGGPNSGHTVTIDEQRVVLRQIPAGIVNPKTKLFLSAGCLIDLEVLRTEIDTFSLTPDRLRIDRNAAIIERRDIEEEKTNNLDGAIGSTCTGVGSAVARRVLRRGDVRLAKDSPELAPYLGEVSREVMSLHKDGKRVVIEGTQGFGLSLYHSPYYPYATSRDTTAAAFSSEVGISPVAVSDVIMVIRTFPIRVGGNSGPLPGETDWETIQRESCYPHKVQEYTTVSNRLRRVGRFDAEIVKRAAESNMPSRLALMGVDYLNYANSQVRCYAELDDRACGFIHFLEAELNISFDLIGTGPADGDLVEKGGGSRDECPQSQRTRTAASLS
jgi:adenylosuccinate synthase